MTATTDLLTGAPLRVSAADNRPDTLLAARRDVVRACIRSGYPTRLAADLLGLSQTQVCRRLRSGTLPGRRDAGRWTVPAQAIVDRVGAPYLAAVAEALDEPVAVADRHLRLAA